MLRADRVTQVSDGAALHRRRALEPGPRAPHGPNRLPRQGDPTDMTGPDDRSTVQIHADGRVLAEAEVRPTGEPGVVASAMHVESGHPPQGTRSRLVDAVLEHPYVDEAEQLVATMPISD